jgi:hypothetical protein
MIPIQARTPFVSTQNLSDLEDLELEAPPTCLPSPWDPSYLLYLEFNDLPIDKEWFPQLKEIDAVRTRLNRLVSARQGELMFHDWVTEIAKTLQNNRFFTGLNYSIPGSSLAQVLGREWVESVCERIESETGRSLKSLKNWIQTLTFNRNDIDARIELTGAGNNASNTIYALLKDRPGHEVVRIGNLAVLVTFGNWDLFIRVQKGRNYVFDGDSAEIRIPYERTNLIPSLSVPHPIGFFHSMVFGVADMTDTNELNEHVWRVLCYRSICGKRLLRQEVLSKIFKAAHHVSTNHLEHQLRLSFLKHAMPEKSDVRYQFLIQLILDQAEQKNWHAACFKAQTTPYSSLWSGILSFNSLIGIRASLLWLGCIALKERWTYPVKASLSERGDNYTLRLETGGKSVWLNLDENINTGMSEAIKLAPQDFWSWLKVIPWQSIQRDEVSFVYDSELKPFIPKLQPVFHMDSSLQRFLQMRQRAVVSSKINWEKLAEIGEKWESTFILQSVEFNEFESSLVEMLPYVDSYAISKVLKWKRNQQRSILSVEWLQMSVWDSIIKAVGTDELYEWVIFCGKDAWLDLDETTKKNILKKLTGNKLSLPNEVKLLEFTQAPIAFWEKILSLHEATFHAPLLLKSMSHHIPLLAKKLHPLAISCFKNKQSPKEAVKLLDYWIDSGNTVQALGIWDYCKKAGLLESWNRSWNLFCLCRGLQEPEVQLLANECSQLKCLDLAAWAAAAPFIAPNIHNREARQALLRIVQGKGPPILLQYFIETNPSLEEAWVLLSQQLDKTSLPNIYAVLSPGLLQAKDPLWLQRAWELFFKAWPLGCQDFTHLKKLIDATLNAKSIDPEFIKIYKSANMNKVPGITGNISLLMKVMNDVGNIEEIELIEIWENWLKEEQGFVKINASNYHSIYRQILNKKSNIDLSTYLRLFYHSKASLEDAAQFITGLTASKNGFCCLLVKEIEPWLPICFEGLYKAPPKVLSKSLRRLMNLSTITKNEKYGNDLQKLIHPILQVYLKKDASFEGLEVLIRQLQKSIRLKGNLDRVEKYLDVILPHLPKDLRVSNNACCKFILSMAETCHLLTIYRSQARSKLMKYIPIPTWSELSIKSKYVSLVVEWIEKLNKDSKVYSNHLVKACMLADAREVPLFTTNMGQVIQCITEISCWTADEVDLLPKAASWFSLFVLDLGQLLGKCLKNEEIIRFFEHQCAFFYEVGRIKSKDDIYLLKYLLKSWEYLPWLDARKLFATIIWKRLQVIERKDLYIYLLLTLQKEAEESHLMGEIQAQMDMVFEVPSLQLSHEEEEIRVERDPVFRGINVCKRVTHLGLATLLSSAVSGWINTMIPRPLTGLTYLQQNGQYTGLLIVGVGAGGMAFLVVGMLVVTLVRKVFLSNR